MLVEAKTQIDSAQKPLDTCLAELDNIKAEVDKRAAAARKVVFASAPSTPTPAPRSPQRTPAPATPTQSTTQSLAPSIPALGTTPSTPAPPTGPSASTAAPLTGPGMTPGMPARGFDQFNTLTMLELYPLKMLSSPDDPALLRFQYQNPDRDFESVNAIAHYETSNHRICISFPGSNKDYPNVRAGALVSIKECKAAKIYFYFIKVFIETIVFPIKINYIF
ncbi:hypothetical protein F5X99DRAFT_393242 [Biscogniauxia marginata]|nr:hypothetical protein F5X99DRAFT_393242 [Biscogniauxia marginata]